jgi:hypothetical protein
MDENEVARVARDVLKRVVARLAKGDRLRPPRASAHHPAGNPRMPCARTQGEGRNDRTIKCGGRKVQRALIAINDKPGAASVGGSVNTSARRAHRRD